MLAELLVLEPADNSSAERANARILLPSGEQDDEWIDCGSVTIHLENGLIASLKIEINAKFWEQVEIEYPQDLKSVDVEQEDLLPVLLYHAQDVTHSNLASSVAIDLIARGVNRSILYNAETQQFVVL